MVRKVRVVLTGCPSACCHTQQDCPVGSNHLPASRQSAPLTTFAGVFVSRMRWREVEQEQHPKRSKSSNFQIGTLRPSPHFVHSHDDTPTLRAESRTRIGGFAVGELICTIARQRGDAAARRRSAATTAVTKS